MMDLVTSPACGKLVTTQPLEKGDMIGDRIPDFNIATMQPVSKKPPLQFSGDDELPIKCLPGSRFISWTVAEGDNVTEKDEIALVYAPDNTRRPIRVHFNGSVKSLQNLSKGDAIDCYLEDQVIAVIKVDPLAFQELPIWFWLLQMGGIILQTWCCCVLMVKHRDRQPRKRKVRQLLASPTDLKEKDGMAAREGLLNNSEDNQRRDNNNASTRAPKSAGWGWTASLCGRSNMPRDEDDEGPAPSCGPPSRERTQESKAGGPPPQDVPNNGPHREGEEPPQEFLDNM
jgi:hypothetical protein